MAKSLRLTNVGIYTKNQQRAREFYVQKIGLKVRGSIPKWGYLELGTSNKGQDASLNIWQPTREVWGDSYDEVAEQVGVVTGIGFRAWDLEKTVDSLKRRKVDVEFDPESEEGMATVTDPDGNTFFIFGPEKPRRRKPGLAALEFVTIVTRDSKRSGDFLTRALGFKRGMEMEEGFFEYRLSPRSTAISPFTPRKKMYRQASDYENDMKHIGEYTGIIFTTDDIFRTQDELFRRDVVFRKKAEKTMWGGIQADLLDPDKNVYSLVQPMTDTKSK